MTNVPWEEMTRRWQDLYNEQAKVAQGWLDSQAQLASTLAGVGADEGGEGNMTADAAALAELWRSGMALGSAGIGVPGLNATSIGNETLGRMLDPVSLSLMGGNRVGEAIRRMTEGPRFADVGSIERGMAQVMELYLEVQTAARSYEGVVARAWVEVNQRFAGEVSKRFSSDRQLLQAKDALKIWLDIANETLMKSHRSTAFLEAQRQLLRAGMDFLLAERKLVEQLVEPAGLPTRSELDELHNTVQTLKRRVRALERARDAEGRSPSRQVAARPRNAARQGGSDDHNAFQGPSRLVARSQ
jgi:polyhydroxyalkanoate synthase subunit PhaE